MRDSPSRLALRSLRQRERGRIESSSSNRGAESRCDTSLVGFSGLCVPSTSTCSPESVVSRVTKDFNRRGRQYKKLSSEFVPSLSFDQDPGTKALFNSLDKDHAVEAVSQQVERGEGWELTSS